MEAFINGFNNLMQINEFETFFKLVLIVILSGFIGWERESWNKPAGFRTHVLVGISAVVVMVCGKYVHLTENGDPTRIPAQLLSGIGFLGAGTILRDGDNVTGLTTAAGLLAVTCVGLAVGSGYYLGAIIATAVIYAVLSYSHVISDKLEHYNFIDFEIKAKNSTKAIEAIKKILVNYELDIYKIKVTENKNDDDIKLLLKHKNEVNMNDLLSQIVELEEVMEVEEVK